VIKKTLGRTGLEVTQLGFGAMEIRGPKVWGGRAVDDAGAEAILNAVLDAGINFIDTSVDYGLSEERIGRFISSRRKEYYLATKCGCDPREVGDKWETPHTWTRDNLLRNIEGSLKRMNTSHVDILQLHNPTPQQVEEGKLVGTLEQIRASGLTKFIGISTTLPHLQAFVNLGVFDTFQIPYSCLEPTHYDAINLAAQAGAGIIVRGGIAKGGPASATPVKDRVDMWKAAKLDEVLNGMSPSELVLRHTLSHPQCHTTIVGTLNREHLRGNLEAAAKGALSAELYAEVRRRVAEAGKK